MLLTPVRDVSDCYILQRNDPPRVLVSSQLEIVQAVVVGEDGYINDDL